WCWCSGKADNVWCLEPAVGQPQLLRREGHSLLKRLREAKKEVPPTEKPPVVKTHLRDMIILPDMLGSIVGVDKGQTFNQVEIKPEKIGHHLSEFSITCKPEKHGHPLLRLHKPHRVACRPIKKQTFLKKKKKIHPDFCVENGLCIPVK
uniref:40S ribosomal protein S15 n=1 Tax=Sus scrofa TaxID=9823 RepID=A0A8D2BLH1_PIG